MSLDFEHGVVFRARSGVAELFDGPISRRSARDMAGLLARRWRSAVEVLPRAADGAVVGPFADVVPSRQQGLPRVGD